MSHRRRRRRNWSDTGKSLSNCKPCCRRRKARHSDCSSGHGRFKHAANPQGIGGGLQTPTPIELDFLAGPSACPAKRMVDNLQRSHTRGCSGDEGPLSSSMSTCMALRFDSRLSGAGEPTSEILLHISKEEQPPASGSGLTTLRNWKISNRTIRSGRFGTLIWRPSTTPSATSTPDAPWYNPANRKWFRNLAKTQIADLMEELGMSPRNPRSISDIRRKYRRCVRKTTRRKARPGA